MLYLPIFSFRYQNSKRQVNSFNTQDLVAFQKLAPSKLWRQFQYGKNKAEINDGLCSLKIGQTITRATRVFKFLKNDCEGQILKVNNYWKLHLIFNLCVRLEKPGNFSIQM